MDVQGVGLRIEVDNAFSKMGDLEACLVVLRDCDSGFVACVKSSRKWRPEFGSTLWKSAIGTIVIQHALLGVKDDFNFSNMKVIKMAPDLEATRFSL